MSIWFLILIIAIVTGATWFFGSWNIMINLINFFIASLVASSYFELVAGQIESINSSYTYLADFVAIWLLFVVTFVFLRLGTDFMSKYQMRMNIWAEYGLRTVLSLWLAISFSYFAFFTFHLAPFAPSDFVSNPQEKLFGFAPDQQWMAFVQSRSRGALAASKNALFMPEYDLIPHPDDVELDCRVFDPHAAFAAKYLKRRISLSESTTLRVNK